MSERAARKMIGQKILWMCFFPQGSSEWWYILVVISSRKRLTHSLAHSTRFCHTHYTTDGQGNKSEKRTANSLGGGDSWRSSAKPQGLETERESRKKKGRQKKTFFQRQQWWSLHVLRGVSAISERVCFCVSDRVSSVRELKVRL